MINLITGKTGNGKSLYAITEIEKRRIEENRIVYYHGIPELTLDWVEFDDARQWASLPDGAIIVIDEARAAFPVRPNGSLVPSYVAAFELHRKQGHDIYILTQQPTFIDSHIRKLTDVHVHLMRKFGDEVSVAHKFFTCKDDCDKNRQGSIATDFVFPKANYGLYKSAELHTIKSQKPFRYYLKYIIPFIVVALCVVAYFAFHAAITSGAKVSDTSKAVLLSPMSPKSPGQTEYKNKEDDPNYFYVQNTPRIATLALSAPKYDEVTKPKIAPIPAACIQSRTKCLCYTQQGTKMVVDEAFCKLVVANGYFVDFVDGVQSQPNINKQAAPDIGIIKGKALDAKPAVLNS